LTIAFSNLDKVLKRCQETGLILNWEKCHFMVTTGVVLGHVVSSKGLEVDQAKIEVIKSLPLPQVSKALEVFLGMPVSTGDSLKIFL